MGGNFVDPGPADAFVRVYARGGGTFKNAELLPSSVDIFDRKKKVSRITMDILSQILSLPPLESRKPLPRGFTLFLFLTLTTTLSLPPRPFRKLLFLAIILPTALTLPHLATSATSNDYWFGILFFGSVYRGIDYIILSHAEKEFYVVGRGEKTPWRRGVGNWSLEKWMWAARIWANNRGVGWSWEVKNIGPKPPVGFPVWWGIPLYSPNFRAKKNNFVYLFFHLFVALQEIYAQHAIPNPRPRPAHRLYRKWLPFRIRSAV
jgi:hypothetical protein